MAKPVKGPEGLPFFLSEVGSKTTITVLVSGPTEAALKQYLAWAEKASGLDGKEVQLRFMDRVISDGIKKDANFRATKNASVKA
jgi:hypothetical protein